MSNPKDPWYEDEDLVAVITNAGLAAGVLAAAGYREESKAVWALINAFEATLNEIESV